MNKEKIIENLDLLFDNFEKIDLKKLDHFLGDILKLFTHLQEKMRSNNARERQEALKLAEQLQAKLGKLSDKAFAAAGAAPAKIQEIVSHRQNFSRSDWEILQKMQREMSEYEKTINY